MPLLLSATVHAAPPASPSARLHFDRKVTREDCPDERAFRALVTARLGRDPFDNREPRAVDVSVTSEASSIVGRVRMTQEGAPAQERTVRGSARDCEAVIEALASIVALNLAPEVEPDTKPREEPRPRPPPSEVRASRADAPVVPRVDGSPPLRFVARGAAVASVGLLPGTSIGGELGAGFHKDWFSLFAAGRVEAQPADATGARGERLEGAVFTGGLQPCFSKGWFVGCGVAWIGVLQGRAPDAARPALGSSMVGFAGARAGVGFPLGSGLRLVPQVEVWVPIVRTTLVYAQQVTWTSPAISGSLGLGLTYFPGS